MLSENVFWFISQDKSKEEETESKGEADSDEQLTEQFNQLNTTDTLSTPTHITNDESIETPAVTTDGNIELTLTKLDKETGDKQVPKPTGAQTESRSEANSSSEDVTSSVSRTCDDHDEHCDGENVTPSSQDSAGDAKGDVDEGVEEDEEGEEAEEDDDEEGWITPSNLQEVQKDMGGVDEEPEDIIVGCMTSDFAMQVSVYYIILSVNQRIIRSGITEFMSC